MQTQANQANPTASRMARAMQEIDAGGMTVNREALGLRGFTSEEIELHHASARDIANKRSRARERR